MNGITIKLTKRLYAFNFLISLISIIMFGVKVKRILKFENHADLLGLSLLSGYNVPLYSNPFLWLAANIKIFVNFVFRVYMQKIMLTLFCGLPMVKMIWLKILISQRPQFFCGKRHA